MVHVGFLKWTTVFLTENIGGTDNICGNSDNICDNLSPYFYRAVMPQCPSVCPSVTFRSLGAMITLVEILRK